MFKLEGVILTPEGVVLYINTDWCRFNTPVFTVLLHEDLIFKGWWRRLYNSMTPAI